MRFVSYNGNLINEFTPIFTATNRSFKYGDGIFETLRVSNHNILLWDYHYERLAKGLHLLQIPFPSNLKHTIQISIEDICTRNNCSGSARVRVSCFREEGEAPGVLIEANALTSVSYEWNERGWTFDLYSGAIKNSDGLANLKSANHLPYVMADRYAREYQFDECLLMNHKRTIADGSRTNVFVIKEGVVYTPPLSSGCVEGVMRRFVLEGLVKLDWQIAQSEIDLDFLIAAEEVFFTNAIIGVQWAVSFRGKRYAWQQTRQLFQQLFTGSGDNHAG